MPRRRALTRARWPARRGWSPRAPAPFPVIPTHVHASRRAADATAGRAVASATGSLGWSATDPVGSELALMGYAGLLGLLGLGRSAAKRGSERVRRAKDIRDAAPAPQGAFTRITQALQAGLHLLQGVEPEKLLALARSPGFQNADRHEQAVQLVNLMGPGAEKLAESAFHVLRMGEQYVPNFSANPDALPASLFEDEEFIQLSAVDRWTHIIQNFPDAAERLGNLAHALWVAWWRPAGAT